MRAQHDTLGPSSVRAWFGSRAERVTAIGSSDTGSLVRRAFDVVLVALPQINALHPLQKVASTLPSLVHSLRESAVVQPCRERGLTRETAVASGFWEGQLLLANEPRRTRPVRAQTASIK